MKRLALFPSLLAILLAAPCLAADFGDRYPQGTLKTREDSKAALAAAREESARLDKEFKVRDAECHRDIFVNSCREKARKEHDLGQRDVRRVEVEARDLNRRIDADELARRKEKAAAEQPASAAAREKKAAESKATVEKREADAQSKPAITPEEAARNRADYEAKVKAQAAREAERKAEAPQRAANAAEYERKQADAARHAQEQEIERKKRDERRAERAKAHAKQEAAREAVRAKAEEAAAAAAKN